MNILRAADSLGGGLDINPYVERPTRSSTAFQRGYKAETHIPAKLNFPGFVVDSIGRFVDFMYRHRNHECFNTWHPENQINWMLILGDSFSFANSGSLLEDFTLEKNRSAVSRFDDNTMRRLDCFIAREGGIMKIYDNIDKLLEKPLKVYKYVNDDIDAREYYNFVVGRTRDCLLRFVKDYATDNSLDKYRRKMVLDPIVNRQGLGIAALGALRNFRGTENSTEKLIKMSLVSTAGKPFTADKFYYRTRELDENPDGVVLHYGSGSTKGKSRLVYNNPVCIDPLWDGEGGYRGTHEDYHEALDNGSIRQELPTLITSDACAYGDTPTELNVKRTATGKSRAIRSMDACGTNFLAADIVTYWRGKGYRGSFVLKLGVCRKLPAPLCNMYGELVMKQRPSNLEVIVHVGDRLHKTPLQQVVDEANSPIMVANFQRLRHALEGSFPEGKQSYSPALDTVLAKTRQSSYFKRPDRYGFQDRIRMHDLKEAVMCFDLDGAQHSGAEVEHTLKLFRAGKYVDEEDPAEEPLRPVRPARAQVKTKAEIRRKIREVC